MSFGDIDDDQDEALGVSRTALDFLHAAQADLRKAAVRTVKLRDMQRPQFELLCRVPSDMDEILGIDERSKDASEENGAPRQEIIDACMTLARFTDQVFFNGLPVAVDGDGEPIVNGAAFAHRPVQESLGVARGKGAAWRTVRELFITDGGAYDDLIIARLQNMLITESGLLRKSVVVSGEDDPT